MNKRRALFTDIDGTLITSDRKITPRTLAAIRAWTEAGNLFILSSSRSAPGIEPIVRTYGLKCAVSATGGALLLDEDRNVIYENGYSLEICREVIRFMEAEQFDLIYNVFTRDRWITTDRSDPRVKLEEGIVQISAEEGSIDDLPQDAVIDKILCMCAPGTIDQIEARLKEEFPRLSICQSSAQLLEINNIGVSKAVAVQTVCEHYGIDIADTVAFGDNFNDLDMLKTAAFGVAMGNAPAEIKEACDRITEDNDHDGVAIMLEEIRMKD